MDIHRIQSARDLARLQYEEVRREVAQDSRDRVRSARDELARLSSVRAQRLEAARQAQADARTEEARPADSERSDRVQISERGRVLARDPEARDADDARRAERVVELEASHRAGRLVTPEAVERAASRLLGAERSE